MWTTFSGAVCDAAEAASCDVVELMDIERTGAGSASFTPGTEIKYTEPVGSVPPCA